MKVEKLNVSICHEAIFVFIDDHIIALSYDNAGNRCHRDYSDYDGSLNDVVGTYENVDLSIEVDAGILCEHEIKLNATVPAATISLD